MSIVSTRAVNVSTFSHFFDTSGQRVDFIDTLNLLQSTQNPSKTSGPARSSGIQKFLAWCWVDSERIFHPWE